MSIPSVNKQNTQPVADIHRAAEKFLTFFLGQEEYGIEILKVQEIMGYQPIIPVPCTPAYILGIINLRGHVIQVVDLRAKFEMPQIEPTSETCIVVVRVGEVEMGVKADKVSEVIEIAPGQIEPVPCFGVGIDTDFILGLGKNQNKVKILLDIEKVLPTNILAAVKEVVAN